MTLSTLSIDWSALMNYVADYLGMGRETTPASYASWSADDYARINEEVQAGYRQMLWPPPLPGERKSHEWSCLRGFRRLNTVANKKDYVLPDDVGAVIGSIMFGEGDGTVPITRVKLDKILRLRQHERGTSTPQHYTVTQMADKEGQGQIRMMMFWPEPDASYQLDYQCYLVPNVLSSTSPDPLFGPIHAETLKQSCLAAAELHMEGAKGEQWDRFMERLRASIQIDRQTMGPDRLSTMGRRTRLTRNGARAISGYYVTLDDEMSE